MPAKSGCIHLKDDKILVAWNGLMIAALARGSQALGDGSYAQAAVERSVSSCKKCRPQTGASIAGTGRVKSQTRGMPMIMHS